MIEEELSLNMKGFKKYFDKEKAILLKCEENKAENWKLFISGINAYLATKNFSWKESDEIYSWIREVKEEFLS